MSEEQSEATAQQVSSQGTSRRNLLSWLVRGFLSLWGVAFAWVVGAFVRAPHSPTSLTETELRVGPVEELAVGQATLVQHGKDPIWVIRTAEDTWVGRSAVCTHLRCILTWDAEQQILGCPCHDGSFDLNGNVLSGPPPRGLRDYDVEAKLGQVYVHI